MAPKKKKKADEGGDPGLSPSVFLSNYTKHCKLSCVPVNSMVVDAFSKEERVEELLQSNQLVLNDSAGPLGPSGTRALCAALMGAGQGMSNVQCRLVKRLRMWRVDSGDDGAACVAELLRLGGSEVALSYLELLDCNVGTFGAKSLGRSLSFGQNKSLMTLKLDYNSTLGAQGVAALCVGLRTNSSLKQLHLAYCQIDDAAAIGEMLTYHQTKLSELNMQGNKLGGKGLFEICKGLSKNTALTTLSLADNGIGRSAEEDIPALSLLGTIMLSPQNSLVHVDILYNRIGENGGEALLKAFDGPTPQKIKVFLLDSTLPDHIFDRLCRIPGSGGKKKKKKKKK